LPLRLLDVSAKRLNAPKSKCGEIDPLSNNEELGAKF
jgi:hypothetical protein